MRTIIYGGRGTYFIYKNGGKIYITKEEKQEILKNGGIDKTHKRK